jgi:hypothetical protein
LVSRPLRETQTRAFAARDQTLRAAMAEERAAGFGVPERGDDAAASPASAASYAPPRPLSAGSGAGAA